MTKEQAEMMLAQLIHDARLTSIERQNLLIAIQVLKSQPKTDATTVPTK